MTLLPLPSPSSGRGELVLQPAYFTSSTFVCAARADVDDLLCEYSERYARASNHPFALFKQLWQAQGWQWIQLTVFDARSREAFLRVVMRLFLERVGHGETPLNRAAALFGLYTVFCTQPSTSAPSLHRVTRIEVTCDVYKDMLMLPHALDEEPFLPVRPHVLYVRSELLQAQVFQILPHAEMGPLNPRTLPREVVVEDEETAQGHRKRGRPSRREGIKRARAALVALDGRCVGSLGSQPSETRDRYAEARTALVEAMDGDEGALRAAEATVAERMDHIVGLNI